MSIRIDIRYNFEKRKQKRISGFAAKEDADQYVKSCWGLLKEEYALRKGSVIKRNASWEIRYDINAPGEPRRQRRTCGFASKAEAERALREKLVELDRNQLRDAQAHTVRSWCEYWMLNYVKLECEETTYAFYASALRALLPHMGDIPLGSLSISDIQRQVRRLMGEGLSARTVHAYIDSLSTALELAVRQKMIYENPCNSIALPKYEPTQVSEEMALTPEQIAEVIRIAPNDVVRYMILVAVLTGMRRGEICGLKWSAISGNTLRVQNTRVVAKAAVVEKGPKTAKGRRTIAIPDLLVQWFKQWHTVCDAVAHANNRARAEYVFEHPDGRPYYPSYLTNSIYDMRKAHPELPYITAHFLRHSYASVLIRRGEDVRTVSAALGHERPSTTMNKYANLFADADQRVSNAIQSAFSNVLGDIVDPTLDTTVDTRA